MASLAMALPLLPGKTEAWKQWVAEMAGPRLGELQSSRARLNITKEVSTLQSGPQGDVAVLFIEAENIPQALQGLALSQNPFDVTFRQKTLEFFGLDMTQPPAGPPPQTLLDWQSI